MAKYSIEDSTLTSIADAIRDKTGSTEAILTEDMAQGVVAASEKYRKKLTDLASRRITEISAQDFDGLDALGANAFTQCQRLKTVHLARSIFALSNYTFQDCTGLEIVKCYLSNISYASFERCTSLRKFDTYSGNVSSIGTKAFNGCNSIAYVNLSKSSNVPTMGNINAFNGIPDYAKLVVNSSLRDSFSTASNWSNFAHMIIGADPNDEIGIIDLYLPNGKFAMSFCFIKGKTWREMMNEYYAFFDVKGTDIIFDYYIPDVVTFETYNNLAWFTIVDENMADLSMYSEIIEGRYNLRDDGGGYDYEDWADDYYG